MFSRIPVTGPVLIVDFSLIVKSPLILTHPYFVLVEDLSDLSDLSVRHFRLELNLLPRLPLRPSIISPLCYLKSETYFVGSTVDSEFHMILNTFYVPVGCPS